MPGCSTGVQDDNKNKDPFIERLFLREQSEILLIINWPKNIMGCLLFLNKISDVQFSEKVILQLLRTILHYKHTRSIQSRHPFPPAQQIKQSCGLTLHTCHMSGSGRQIERTSNQLARVINYISLFLYSHTRQKRSYPVLSVHIFVCIPLPG